MLEQWEADGETCEERIKSFINILIMNRAKILLYGCPVGTLCTELAKLDHSALPQATKVFGFFFSSRRRHTRSLRDWSSDVCSSDLRARAAHEQPARPPRLRRRGRG